MAYSYKISLQVKHPYADPNDIVSGLGLQPYRTWKVGDPRPTPKGTPLQGTYRETYCVFDLSSGDDGELAESLRSDVEELRAKSDYLAYLRDTGGSLAFFIAWETGSRGETFEAGLLADIARLGIDLGIQPITSA